ncbi:MAG: amidoligase family protein [Clostridiales bacterium]|nr:amidoligase family protein [Clostridiales bacterium]
MFSNKFGLELEFTGITRGQAAKVAADYFGVALNATHDSYDTYIVRAADGRIWKFVSDASINCQKRSGHQTVSAGRDYAVELVSPVLMYREDIKTVQELVRRLRKAKGFANKSCGIHVHLDGSNHTARSIRNFVNIVASHNDLFYKSLQIAPERMRFCKKMDSFLIERMNRQKPQTFQQIETIWYEGYHGNRSAHYHDSRYHFLNLHSFFTGHHTVELRGFNSELHAGKVRAYIVLALALNNQALTQKSASSRKVQEENEKFAMRYVQLVIMHSNGKTAA